MKIGLTFDLRSEYLAAGFSELETAEFDRDDTVAAIEVALQYLGHRTDRIGSARRLIERLAAGDRWELVFNIAEGLNGIGREAQVPAILDVYGIPYTFSDPLVMSLTLQKAMTNHVVRDAGVPTADFILVRQPGDLDGLRFAPPYFVKPVAEGTGKGVSPASIVRSREALDGACRALLAQFRHGILVETYLPGREFTVGIVGTGPRAEAIGTIEVILLASAEPGVYSYTNKEHCEELVEYRLAESASDPQVHEAEAIALKAWRVLDCRDAGRVDLRSDAHGHPKFMEVNPLAGIHPQHSDLPIICTKVGMSYEHLIERIVASAQERIQPAATVKGGTD
jgi:D-alanine-D-alanine ligase